MKKETKAEKIKKIIKWKPEFKAQDLKRQSSKALDLIYSRIIN